MFPLYDNNPTSRAPIITRWLIYLNVGAFIAQWLLPGDAMTFALQYGFVPARASESVAGEIPNVLTSMFLHANVAHLAWNMLFLHIFGDNVEDLLGHQRYVVFYLLSGAGGAAGQYFIDPASVVPMVGASGAIAGVLGAYLVLHPKAPVVLLNPVLPLWLLMGPLLALPAWAVVGYWFLGNLMGGIASLGTTGGGVAFFAHLGGFVTGLLATRPLLDPDAHVPKDSWTGWRAPPRRAPRRKIFWKNDDRPFWR